jgi:hypothetical protein
LRARLKKITAAAVSHYKPVEFDGRLCQILPSKDCVLPYEATAGWSGVARQFEQYYGPDGCEGDVMILEPYASSMAELFRHYRDHRTV